MCSRICFFSACILLSSGDALAERMRIVVGGANFRAYPVAVSDVELGSKANDSLKKISKEFLRLLRRNVDFPRSLELVPPGSYLSDSRDSARKPYLKNWINVGASGLITSSIGGSPNQIKLTMRFFDVVRGKTLLTKQFEKSAEVLHRSIYEFLDAVVGVLTGEQGIYSARIAYVKRMPRGKSIFVATLDGKEIERVTAPNVLSLLPAWSADGKHLFFTSYLKNNPDLFQLEIAGRKLDWISKKRGLNIGAAVSPDNSKIALTLSIDGNTEIYLMNRDGKKLRRLTDSWGQDVSPSWSPDGSQIAFVSSRSGNPHIYVMVADGTQQRRLTFQGKYNQEPDWSPKPDGQITFTARDERLAYDIFLVHPKTGVITRLTQDQANNESPQFSPDGQQIVFTSTRGPKHGKKLYVMDVDGSNQRHIVLDGIHIETPAWGPREIN